jgi:RecG-like helicase
MRVIGVIATLIASAAAACVPFTEAKKHVGDSLCITGKVLKVANSPRSGTHFLNFCENYRDCPFSVVVFAKDLSKVGDVRQLEGQEIKIYGKVRQYKGEAEIILNDVRQLKGEATKLPPVPKSYDAENRGRYSAGRFKDAREKKTREKKPAHGPTTTEPPDDAEDR